MEANSFRKEEKIIWVIMQILREPIWRLSIANHLELKCRLTKSIDLKLESKIDKHPNLRLILLEKWKYHLSNHADI